MSPEAQRGKVIVMIVLGTLLCSDVLIVGLTVARKGLLYSGSSIVRFLFTVALCYAVFSGRTWARWLTVGLISIAFMMMAVFLFRTQHPLIIATTILFGAAASLLTFPPSVSAFFRHHRKRPNEIAS